MVAPQTLTVTLEEVQIKHLLARSKATGQSLSQLVREILAKRMQEEKAQETAE